MAEESSSAQKRAFKDTPLLFLNDLRTCAVELLYKRNIAESQSWQYAISHFYLCDIANIKGYI